MSCIPPSDEPLDKKLFVKLSNKNQYKLAIMEQYQQLYPGFGSTIGDMTDRSVLVHGTGTRTDLFPKEGGDFAPKLLTLNEGTGRFRDVPFDLAEDVELSRQIISLWSKVTALVSKIPHNIFEEAPFSLKTDKELKETKKKKKKQQQQQPSASGAGTAAPRRKQNRRHDESAQAAKKQKTHADASHAALFAFIKLKHPSLADSAFELSDESSHTSLKFVNKDSGHCPMKGSEHRHTRNVALFVESNGSYNFTCFHPDCNPAVTGSLPTELVAKLFSSSEAPLDFSTDLQASKLFKNHVLQGRAMCLCGDGKGMYIFDESTGLWAMRDKSLLRYRIQNEFPAWIEANDTAGNGEGARRFEDISGCNPVLTSLLPQITDERFADDLDACTHVLSLANGLLDLRTLTMRPRCLEDKITKCMTTEWPEETAAASMETPLIDSYFRQLLAIKDPLCVREEDRQKGCDDTEGILDFLQVLLGYSCLSGSCDAQVLTFMYGSTAGNAKTATLNLLANLLEKYAGALDKSESDFLQASGTRICQPHDDAATREAHVLL